MDFSVSRGKSELYRTQGAKGSLPAMQTRRNEDMNKMYKIKDVNVRMNVIYNTVCVHAIIVYFKK
jgi:hypothetical protein